MSPAQTAWTVRKPSRGWTLVIVLLWSRMTAAAPLEASGFPALLPANGTVRSLTIADLDGNGRPQLILVAGDKVLVMTGSGQMRTGFPATLHSRPGTSSLLVRQPPAACDINADGKPEIVVAGSNQQIYALTLAGATVPSFPVGIAGTPRGPVSCLPRKGTRQHDLVLTSDLGTLWRVPGAGGEPQAVTKLGPGAESGVAVVDLDGDGSVELIAGGGDSRLYVVDQQGRRRTGWPYAMAFRTSGVPAVADVDDDGALDIVVGSQDFRIHGVRADGSTLTGFPIDTGYRVYGGAALADLDGDHVLDVVIGSGDQHVYAVNGHGQPLPGFPARLDGRVVSDCVIGDLDRDGRHEIVVATEAGTLWMIYPGRQQRRVELSEAVTAGPVLGDLDGDGLLEIALVTKDATLHALKVDSPQKAAVALLAWPQIGHDAAHSGHPTSSPARFHDLSWNNPSPRTTEPLQIKYRFFDADGDLERDTRIRWYCNGKLVPTLDQQRFVPPGMARKHERWSFSLQEGDNHRAFGVDSVLSRTQISPLALIRNTPPPAPTVAIAPTAPQANMPLTASVVQPAADPDGDVVEYRFLWLRNGAPVQACAGSSQVPAALTRKHDEWRVQAIPYDGEELGPAATSSVRIRNTPPPPPRLSVSPEVPRANQPLTVVAQAPAPDEDGDHVTYAFRFWADGRPIPLCADSAVVPPGLVRKHQTLRIEATAHDGEETGGLATLQVIIYNTAPRAPQIAIWPVHPRTSDDLSLVIQSQPPDEDGDTIDLRHTWWVDGKLVRHGQKVPAAATRKGQRWRLAVTPSDGESDGPTVAIETIIENSPPIPPQVALERYWFRTGEAVVPEIRVPAIDSDGDAVRLRYLWRLSGSSLVFADDQTRMPGHALAKGQRWSLTIVPTDTEEEGSPVTMSFEVVNSPPTAPLLKLSSSLPTRSERISVHIASPATDIDGDALIYHYRWWRDGQRLSSWPPGKAVIDTGESRAGQQWRVEVRAFDGEGEGEPGVLEFAIHNAAPEPPRIFIAPAAPRTTDDLWCKRDQPAQDVDTEHLTYHTKWWVNEFLAPLPLDMERVSHELTRSGQIWACEMSASDGKVSSASVRSSPVVIVNTPPQAPTILIVPRVPTTEDDLRCRLEQAGLDADLDPVQHSFLWRVDGEPVPANRLAAGSHNAQSLDLSVVPAAITQRGQIWECESRSRDAVGTGEAAIARVTIGNAPPTTPKVRLLPAQPAAGQEIRCEITEPAHDPDRDAVQYQYIWVRDRAVQAFAPTSDSVPGRMVKTDSVWTCQVLASDGLSQATPASSDPVTVRAASR